jgi:hypothetical protein
MAKDINNDAFDEATKKKLEIFGDSFKKWFPVFYMTNIQKGLLFSTSFMEVEKIKMELMDPLHL